MKERIIQASEELFLKFGIRSVTMDEIAGKLSISKKTIYQYYSDKNTLVSCVAEEHMKRDKQSITEINDSSADAVDEILKISEHVNKSFQDMNPCVMYDMQKYYPGAYELYLEHKNNYIKDCIVENLKEGIKQGYYRSNIKIEILARLRLAEIELMFDPDFLKESEYTIIDVHNEVFENFLYGICTKSGMEKVELYRTNNK